jgi:hypothetical protein
MSRAAAAAVVKVAAAAAAAAAATFALSALLNQEASFFCDTRQKLCPSTKGTLLV